MTIAVILFAVIYISMLLFSKYRPYIALGGGVLFLLGGMLPWNMALGAIDWNVLLMIAGTMGLVKLFVDSRMPALLADLVMEHTPHVQGAAVALALLAGVISALVDNVATVLMVAPVALEICKKLRTNPVPFIIGIAVSSNLQGAATMVGDTTAMMLGSYAGMNFMDFFFYRGRPGIFFAVELGALASAGILAWLFRREKAPITRKNARTKVQDYVPGILLLTMILLMVAASFIPEKPDCTNGLICMTMLAIGCVRAAVRAGRLKVGLEPLTAVDLETLGLLTGLFLVIGGMEHVGAIDAAAALLARLGGGNVFVLYTLILWASVLLSAFIDNIPYVATMLPVVTGLAQNLGMDPTLLYFGLLSGATLGGNCTPIGASANIAGIGILRREGYPVKTGDFMRIGIPFTLAAVLPAYVYFWILFR